MLPSRLISLVNQPVEGWISMTEQWDSSASSLPRQCILFVLRLPSCREAWQSHYQHAVGGLRAVVLGICWLQRGRDGSLAGEIAADLKWRVNLPLGERRCVWAGTASPHLRWVRRGRSRSGQTKTARDPPAGSEGREAAAGRGCDPGCWNAEQWAQQAASPAWHRGDGQHWQLERQGAGERQAPGRAPPGQAAKKRIAKPRGVF